MYTRKDKLQVRTYDRLTKHATIHQQREEYFEAMFFDKWATLINNLICAEKLR